ncbi:MAG TPA: PQQ-dependent sugar dehydrogenase [Mycobacteriales bacterium]|nr:PQQ-dependent sugar dehydrogenase [Mycobacteriales bacterium]
MRRSVLVPLLVLALAAPAAPAGAQEAAAPVDVTATACPPSAVPGGRYDDVLPGGEQALAVDCLTVHGLLRGRTDALFDRLSGIPRAQVAVLLDRVSAYAVQASGSGAVRSGTAAFDDLDSEPAEVREAVGRLVEEGVLRGSRDGDREVFRPRELLSRGQMAAVLRRSLDAVSRLATGTAAPRRAPVDAFDDDAGSVFEDDIGVVAAEGLAAGTGPRRFDPGSPVTRQQMALFAARLLEVEAAAGRVPARWAPGGGPLTQGAVAVPGAPAEVARGLSVPWSLAPLPGGGALVSERDSALLKRVAADGTVTTLGQVPGVVPGGEGGLLGLALSPSFATDGLVYAYVTASADNRVVRFRLAPGPTAVEPVLTGIPKGSIHNGGRLRFGPDGMLYVGTGDAAVPSRAPDPGSLAGKVLRVTPGGGVPAGSTSRVWSRGHRNVQGLAFDEAGRLWASELGQSTADEVALVRPGRDHGWPAVEGLGRRSPYVDPQVTWAPAEASPSGATHAAGSLWVAALRGQRLWQVPLAGEPSAGAAARPRAHLVGAAGRLRDVQQVADGSLWVLTNEADARVLRVPLG